MQARILDQPVQAAYRFRLRNARALRLNLRASRGEPVWFEACRPCSRRLRACTHWPHSPLPLPELLEDRLTERLGLLAGAMTAIELTPTLQKWGQAHLPTLLTVEDRILAEHEQRHATSRRREARDFRLLYASLFALR